MAYIKVLYSGKIKYFAFIMEKFCLEPSELDCKGKILSSPQTVKPDIP